MEKRIINENIREQFKEYLKNEERSKGTIEKYIRDIRMLENWLDGENVTKEKLTEWKQTLIDSGRSPVTINSMIAAVNTFLKSTRWVEMRINSIRVQKKFFRRENRDLSRCEYERLIKAAYAEGREKLALLMETICATGIRVSELKYITLETVKNKKAEIYMKGKYRIVFIPKSLCAKLKKFAKKEKLEGELFVTGSGRSIDRRQIWAEMKSLCQSAGIAVEKVFPHNLRHLFAKIFYEKFKDVVALSDALGHSNIETTRIYLICTEEEQVAKITLLGLSQAG